MQFLVSSPTDYSTKKTLKITANQSLTRVVLPYKVFAFAHNTDTHNKSHYQHSHSRMTYLTHKQIAETTRDI